MDKISAISLLSLSAYCSTNTVIQEQSLILSTGERFTLATEQTIPHVQSPVLSVNSSNARSSRDQQESSQQHLFQSLPEQVISILTAPPSRLVTESRFALRARARGNASASTNTMPSFSPEQCQRIRIVLTNLLPAQLERMVSDETNGLEEKVRHLEEELTQKETLEKNLVSLRRDLTQARESITELQEEIKRISEAYQKNYLARRSDTRSFTQEKKDFVEQLSSLRDELRLAKETTVETQQRLDSECARISKEFEAERRSLIQQVEHFQQRFDVMERQLRATEKSVRDTHESAKRHEQKRDAEKQKLEEQVSTLRQESVKVAELEKELKILKQTKADSVAELQRLGKEHSRLSKDLEMAQQAVRQTKESQKQSEEKAKAFQDTLDKERSIWEKEKARLEKELKQEQDRLARQSQQINSLNAQILKMTKEHKDALGKLESEKASLKGGNEMLIGEIHQLRQQFQQRTQQRSSSFLDAITVQDADSSTTVQQQQNTNVASTTVQRQGDGNFDDLLDEAFEQVFSGNREVEQEMQPSTTPVALGINLGDLQGVLQAISTGSIEEVQRIRRSMGLSAFPPEVFEHFKQITGISFK